MRSRALAIGFRVALGAIAIAWPKSIGAAPRLDAAFVELFAGTRRHPLADPSGRLPLAIELPPFADPRRLGFQPRAPGLPTVGPFPAQIAPFAASHPVLRFPLGP